MKFEKPPLSHEHLLLKLQGRGLSIPDAVAARWALRCVGYYRLAAYTLPFQQGHLPDKPFVAGASMSQILALYSFDRELRLLVLDAIERIEVALRTAVVHRLSLAHGAHWFMESSLFAPRFDHAAFINGIEEELALPNGGNQPRRQHAEVFINHYYRKYGEPRLPPSWMVAETLSFGSVSRLFSGIACSKMRQSIADSFAYNEAILGPWLHTLTYIRNLCAHHARLWNRQLVIKAQIPKRHAKALPRGDRFYAVALVLADLLTAIEPQSHWRFRLRDLIERHPEAERVAMGMPSDWKAHPLWNETPPPPLSS